LDFVIFGIQPNEKQMILLKKFNLFIAMFAVSLSVLFVSCDSDEEETKKDETETGTKPTATTIKFAANGKDCGITDGFANQQHSLASLVHLNLDKCNDDINRPTLTLNFEFGKTIAPGTYTVVASSPKAGEFTISSSKYNYADWEGTAGSVVVTANAEDATKIDIELKSITMKNLTAGETKNPATDTLTGYIIKI
jgi:hypothetical protein